MAAKKGMIRSKSRINYDRDFKNVVVKYALENTNKAASLHFGINESNVRRWKRLIVRGELLENPLARKMPKKANGRRRGRSRKRKRGIFKPPSYRDEDSSDLGYSLNTSNFGNYD
ncbi:hypothetical protein HHI36_021585 [Cryptolaemus montrouzieri]|uniref:Transposase n=1 Tax=Cryptolaemus montrouzieri TaxID=559131 RepID=A0ABD2MXD0_9CUCU